MNELDQRLLKLSEEVTAAKGKLNTALRSSVIFYIIIIVGVTAYTLYVGGKIRQLGTPQTVAAMIGNAFKEKMPDFQRQLVQQARTQATIMAKQTIDLGERMIPQAEMLAKAKIDAGISAMIDHTVNKAMPTLLESLKASFDEVCKKKDLITDKKLAEEVAALLAARLAAELDNAIDVSFYNELNKLQQDIDAIAQKAPGKLTQRELAEKRVIIYWLYLVEKAEPGTSPLAEVLRFMPEYKFGK